MVHKGDLNHVINLNKREGNCEIFCAPKKGGCMGFLKSLFRGTKGFATATNAILAEYMLPTLETDVKDQVRAQITHIFRAGGFPNLTDDFIYTKFNSESRPVQLNLIALALNDLGIQPPFEWESWHEVRNPFRRDIYDDADIEAVQARLSHQHRVHFQLPKESLHIMDL